MAARCCDQPIVKLLLTNGARVNEKDSKGRTALHEARSQNIPILLDHGADLNMRDVRNKTCLMFKQNCDPLGNMLYAKHMAKLKFEGKFICPENSNFLKQHEDLQKKYEDCLEELEKMKNHDLYNGFSLYDIFKMRDQPKKLIFLTKHNDFVEVFKSKWIRESFKNYHSDLDNVFEEALNNKDRSTMNYTVYVL